MNSKSDFSKVMGLGDIDYEFSLNLTEQEAKQAKFEIDQVKSLSDCKNLLSLPGIKDKMIINSKNNLINLLLFINKTNQSKTYAEYLSVNSLYLNEDLSFIKEKVKNDFEENFLFLIESDVTSPCKFKLNLNVQNKQPKTLIVDSESKDANKAQSEEKKSNEETQQKIQDGEEKPQGKNSEEFKKIKLPSNLQREENTGKDNLVEGSDGKTEIQGVRVNPLTNLTYEFTNLDYIFIDLNKFLSYTEIVLSDLYELLYSKIVQQYLNTNIILIFPTLDVNFNNSLLSPLVDLVCIADLVIYEKKDAVKFCSLLGYKKEEKNFEARFMFLKELKKNGNRSQKTAFFIDELQKLTIVLQDSETNLINFHNEFNFEMKHRSEYVKTVNSHYDNLKYIFLGGFFSRHVQKKPFDVSFQAGFATFNKMLDILAGKKELSQDPDYFLVKSKKQDLLKNSYDEFVGNQSGSKILSNSQDFSNTSKSPNQNSLKVDNSKVLGKEKQIEIEQKRLLTIIEANKKIQQKLNNLLTSNEVSKVIYNDEDVYQMKLGKKLPGLGLKDPNSFSKISNSKKIKDSNSELFNQMKQISQMHQSQIDNSEGPNSLNSQKKKEGKAEKAKSPPKSLIDISKLDAKLIENLAKIQSLIMTTAFSSNSGKEKSQILKEKSKSSQIQRMKIALEPVSNTGIVEVLDETTEKKQKKFKIPGENAVKKPKIKLIEDQKHHIVEEPKLVEEKGRRDDYNDLARCQEKVQKEKKKLEAEKLRKEKEEEDLRKKEEKAQRKREKKEKKKAEEELLLQTKE